MNIRMKKRIAMLVGTMALVGVAGVAQTETRFAVQDAAGTKDMMVVTDSGSIGVNVANPIFKFHLVGTGDPSTAALFVANNGRADGTSLPGDSGGFNFMRNNNVAVNGGLPKANDRLGYFAFGSYIGTGNKYLATVQAYTESDATPSAAPTYLAFGTTSGLNTAERMRITSTGNVGIGITNPNQKIEVNGGVKLNTAATKPACGSTIRGTIWYTQGSVSTADILEVCAKDASNNYAWHTLF